MRRVMRILVAVGACLGLALPATAQVGPYDLHRIFLHDGEPLPSYGDYAVVGDRVVFTLPIGGIEDVPQLQLMSLPLAEVDLERSGRYSESLRAFRYASTRGEADYLAMTDQVAAALEQLRAVEDPLTRLQLAEQARARLLSWSADHFSYRAADIGELAGLFDEVMAELRVAAGEPRFSLELVAGPEERRFEAMMDLPTRARSVALAMAAASRADVAEERVAILRGAATLLAAAGDPRRALVERELAAEIAADGVYAVLAGSLIARAEAARDNGDVTAVDALRTELAVRDAELRHRRPRRVAALHDALAGLRDEALAHRRALDHYETRIRDRLAYERRLRPVTSGLDGLTLIIEAVRAGERVPFASLEHAIERVESLAARLGRLAAPDDLADVQATLSSALIMARQALAHWRRALIADTLQAAGPASAAAGGALLLSRRSREVLLERLFPPAVR